jgi:phenylacetate-coenzyme A ligase PaaK-like adenylate-forming protein
MTEMNAIEAGNKETSARTFAQTKLQEILSMASVDDQTEHISLGATCGEWLLSTAERVEGYVLNSERRVKATLQLMPEGIALQQGAWRAKLAAKRAWRKVPAYRHFLAANGVKSPDGSFQKLPVMNKANYIKAYSTEERCIGGTFLKPGVAIDESSGSSGTPYDWVRGKAERTRTQQTLARILVQMVDNKPRLAINAFSMGAWATGQNMAQALEKHSTVKSTGPDLDKVLHTLEFFGPRFGYFIAGYPPFLKTVLDEMLKRNFPIAEYELHGLVGGEAISEELRRYLLRYFRTCHSGYGASDLEIGVAVETPEATQIRQLLNDDDRFRNELLGPGERVPMVFQYNPMCHYLETSAEGDLIVTLNYSKTLSPRIRYNIGDEARLFTRSELLQRVRDLGQRIESRPGIVPLPLPYLFLYGRRDQTISIMGANIYPADVERALYSQPQLVAGMASFMLAIGGGNGASIHPKLCIEWSSSNVPKLPFEQLARRMEDRLAEINSDFRKARIESAANMKIDLEIYASGAGPFAGKERRIKNRYVASKETYFV